MKQNHSLTPLRSMTNGIAVATAIMGVLMASPTFANDHEIFLGQGSLSGEVTDSSVLLQTRLTKSDRLNASGDLDGSDGVASFQWSTSKDFEDIRQTPFVDAKPDQDFIIRQPLTGLQPDTRYFYRVVFGADEAKAKPGPTATFKTLPGPNVDKPIKFIVASCMNYNKFMHGKQAKASGPVTATDLDKRLGYPAFVSMRRVDADFFVGTGDIVYYDHSRRPSQTVEELRLCWHEQFRFPRLIDFFGELPTYWSKDDHDFRFNDSDNTSTKLPLPATGIDIFREQLPIVPMGDDASPTYRTHRVTRDVQIWLTEGRDFRSPNKMDDGPEKSLWGDEQLAWLHETLKASDARWKILITPTPMVGPDDAYKKDNHANLKGFRHEADAFFDWLADNEIRNFVTICGDRHWQYHSIHPSGINEFACGAINDENSRRGVPPGDPKGTDPDALIDQPFIYQKPSGGFLVVSAGEKLRVEMFNDDGESLYTATRSAK